MVQKTNRIERYYDTHEIPGGEGLSQTFAHFNTIWYLINSNENIFYGQKVGVLSTVKIWLNKGLKKGQI